MDVPFTTEEFIGVVEKYNSFFFPIQILVLLLGIIAVVLLHSKIRLKDQLISGFLGLLWIWVGIAYHFAFFTVINPAAWIFGSLFILQGLFFILEGPMGKKITFHFDKTGRAYTGYFFIVFGILIYPIIQYFMEMSWLRTISLGLPCPTTILTFGLLMLTTRSFRKYLLIIPSIWAIIGSFAAIKFNVYQDVVMLLAAIVADIWLLKRKKSGQAA
ncbi:MAG: DUF6064 family protein [Bacteroidales bacterium]|nr:DUF6064 family protein [Bacteroidales bacterium]MCF8343835.1 DUF6064 family protein [Bacteroidales bacterium]MCF8351024.1 DUF6064 family protein [Bacteroidales bacterium]MCF8375840.1 DUF6064 family protein [Bacteroidales bacterium]MCF8401727.1 DUF6064 family protein [Bacteroidales bacterium]